MSDLQEDKPTGAQPSWFDPGKQNAQLVYILYLVSFAIGLTVIVGLVFAYLNRGKSEEWIDTHYTYAIRTFWIGVVYSIISALLFVIGIGFILMIVAGIWFIIRCIKGLQMASRNQPVANVETWLI